MTSRLDSIILRGLGGCVCLICLLLFILVYTLVYSSTLRNLPDTVVKKALSLESGGGLWALSKFIDLGPERLWVIQPSTPQEKIRLNLAKGQPAFAGRLLADVSWDLEFSFLLSSMQTNDWTNKKIDFEPYVVDLGAFEGKLSSNSYNFFQLGTEWSGLLVEAAPRSMVLAKENTNKFLMLGNKITYEESFVQAQELGANDSRITKLRLSTNPTQHTDKPSRHVVLQSSIDDDGNGGNGGNGGSLRGTTKSDNLGAYHDVTVRSVREIFESHKVPKRFAVLDVDVEGQGTVLVKQVLALGYQPQYILSETGYRNSLENYELVGRIHFNMLWRRKDD